MISESRRIFISYSTADTALAERICGALEAAALRCWIAPRDIPAGADWAAAIVPAIDECAVLVLLFSSAAAASPEVGREVVLAQAGRKPILPFRLENIQPAGPMRLALSGAQWLDALCEPRDTQIVALVNRTTELLATSTSPMDAAPEPIDAGALPPEVTSFHGRASDISDVAALLTQRPLVTLIGPGGVGKSRLALHIARRLRGDLFDAAWLVELAPLENAGLVLTAIAEDVGAKEESGHDLLENIAAAIGTRPALLVLDNCEHLIQACAAAAAALIQRIPALRIAATSRIPLGVPGEWQFRVEPLALPRHTGDGEAPTQQELEASPAAALLLERAHGHHSRTQLDASERAAVARICRQLDGLPLALELAAARAKLLSFEQLSDRLNQRFRLLKTDETRALPRHQALHATIQWSYELLDAKEQELLRRLGVFAGRFTVDGAAALGEDDDEFATLDGLQRLLNSSLLTGAGTAAGERHYTMLESIREFALEALAASAETAAILERRLAFWRQRSQVAAERFSSAEDRWPERLEAEIDELRSVIEWCLTHAPYITDAVHIAYHLARFWHDSGRFGEASRIFQAVLDSQQLDREANPIDSARALFGCGVMLNYLDQPTQAIALLEEALDLFETLGDLRDAARTLNILGVAAQNRGDTTAAIQYLERCVVDQRAAKDGRGEMIAMSNLGNTLLEEPGRLGEASALFEDALRLAREASDRLVIANGLTHLADIAGYQEDFDTAIRYGEEARLLWSELRNDAFEADVTSWLAWFYLGLGRRDRALQYLGQSIPRLVELKNKADISNAAVILAAALASSTTFPVCMDLLTFADDLRSTTERVRSSFERRLRDAAGSNVDAHRPASHDLPPAQSKRLNIDGLVQLVNAYAT